MEEIHQEDDIVDRDEGLRHIVTGLEELAGEYPGFGPVSPVHSVEDGGQLPSVMI